MEMYMDLIYYDANHDRETAMQQLKVIKKRKLYVR